MGRKQVSTRVTEEKKVRWREYAEETHGSMTALIRQAVDSYVDNDIARNPDGWAESDGQGGSSPEMMNDVSAAIDSLENTVNDMDGRLRAVRESVQSGGPQFSFRAAVRETVPESDTLTAGQIAARLDARESDVREALETLEDTEEVRRTPEGEGDEPAWTTFGGA